MGGGGGAGGGEKSLNHNRRMTSRLMTLLIWAAVAASAVYWGLRLFVRPTALPAQAVVALAPAPAGGDLGRLLGTPPPAPVAETPVLPADSRFRLLGVVAPRAGQASGLALISVDGKPARTLAQGRELEPGLRLLSVSHRQVELGAARGAPALTLSLPALPEAARGRPGEVGQGLPPVGVQAIPPTGMLPVPGVPMPAQIMPGRPGMVPGAMPQPGQLSQPGPLSQPAGMLHGEAPTEPVQPTNR